MHAREMIGTHPAVQGQVNDALIRCIEECYSCAQTCTACADACLSERMVHPPGPGLRRHLHHHRPHHDPQDRFR